jgi:hypothetical protein
VEQALQRSPAPAVQQITLTTIAGRPSYRLKEGDGTWRVVDATTGAAAPPVDAATALRSAQAFLSGAAGQVLGRTQGDRWSHAGLLDAHRPLYQVQMHDAAQTLLYISSTTGEVVVDVPRYQGYWNYVGAWLHWVYMFRDGAKDPVWSWLVIGLSAGHLSALAGALVGIWRWRFSGRYKSGAKTPYREFQMRWHHITGLVFGLVMVLWIFSGLMSMNPLGIFSPTGARPDLRAYQQGLPGTTRPALAVQDALQLLQADGFDTREIEWKVLAGRPYLLALDAAGASRVLSGAAGSYQVQRGLEPAQLERAAPCCCPSPSIPPPCWTATTPTTTGADRHPCTPPPPDLPVLRVQFQDPGRTSSTSAPHPGKWCSAWTAHSVPTAGCSTFCIAGTCHGCCSTPGRATSFWCCSAWARWPWPPQAPCWATGGWCSPPASSCVGRPGAPRQATQRLSDRAGWGRRPRDHHSGPNAVAGQGLTVSPAARTVQEGGPCRLRIQVHMLLLGRLKGVSSVPSATQTQSRQSPAFLDQNRDDPQCRQNCRSTESDEA